MTFYQELQLNQAGSKRMIKNAKGIKEKLRHTAIYLFKILLTLVFCMLFVILYSKIFGSANSIVGVVVVLCVMVFRFADLGIRTPDALKALSILFAILTFGPKLANLFPPLLGMIVNAISIFLLMILGCHNVVMANHSTLVLGYLLLYGYDVSGEAYLLRVAALSCGAILTGAVYYRNHKKKVYKREAGHLLQEFDIFSLRTKWQISLTFGVSTVLFLMESFHLPRTMWAGIAVMSVMLPFREDLKRRVSGRIPGNVFGGIAFFIIGSVLPKEYHSYIGIIGGIGVGLSASYGWQAVFNSLGAMAVASSFLGIPGAIFFRVFHNVFGAVYGLIFEKIFHIIMEKLAEGHHIADVAS